MDMTPRQMLITVVATAAVELIPTGVAWLVLRGVVGTMDRGLAFAVAGVAFGPGVLMIILVTMAERSSSRDTFAWRVAFGSIALLSFFVFGWLMYTQQVWLALGGGILLVALAVGITADVSGRRRTPPRHP